MKRLLPVLVFFLVSHVVFGSDVVSRDPVPIDLLPDKAQGIVDMMTSQRRMVTEWHENARAEGNFIKQECMGAVMAGLDTVIAASQELSVALPVQIEEDTTAAAQSYTQLITQKERAQVLENNARSCEAGGNIANPGEFSESMNVAATVALVERRLGRIINHRMRELSGGKLELPGPVGNVLDSISLAFWRMIDRVREQED